MKFDFIIDTQKTLLRTIALKRIQSDNFISATAGGFFSTKKIYKNKNKRQYYLIDLFNLLDLIKPSKVESDFKFKIPERLISKLDKKMHIYVYFMLPIVLINVGLTPKDMVNF